MTPAFRYAYINDGREMHTHTHTRSGRIRLLNRMLGLLLSTGEKAVSGARSTRKGRASITDVHNKIFHTRSTRFEEWISRFALKASTHTHTPAVDVVTRPQKEKKEKKENKKNKKENSSDRLIANS